MKRIIFCNIAWMKNYCGITEDDKPYNGGSYVEENGDAAESCNFFPHNHICYGYFASKGQNLSLNRVDESVGNNTSAITGVTVVWVANRKIVGWYENAKMYRKMQEFFDESLGEDKIFWIYNFMARENDVYLIPNDIRDFDIPSAPRAGSGRGMGQSNIWYADSDYAREVFVPQVLVYLEKTRNKCIQNIITPEQFNKKSALDLPNDQLMKRANIHILNNNHLIALQIYNLIRSRPLNPQDSCAIKFLRGKMLQKLLIHDEALENYKCFKYEFENLSKIEKTVKTLAQNDLNAINLERIYNMASIYMSRKKYFETCLLYEEYITLTEDIEQKCNALWNLMYAFKDQNDWKQLRKAIIDYDNLNTELYAESIEDNYRKALEEETGEYIEHIVEFPEREKLFPKIFNFKGIKFKRMDDGENIDDEHKFEFNKITQDYAPKIAALCKKFHDNPNIKVAIANCWQNYKIENFYEEYNEVPLPNGVTKFPFDCDVLIVDVVLDYNIKAILTHSIFTEYTHTFNLQDFTDRDEDNGGFDIDSDYYEIYLVDYTNATKDVIKYNGVIKYTDDELE